MILPTLRTALLLLATGPLTLAQVTDMLDNTATFRPKITLSDSYSEKVVAEVDGANTYRSVVPNAEKIAVTVVANLVGMSTGTIDGDASIGISVGNFDYEDSLGDAIDYKPGLKKATFPLIKQVFDNSGNEHDVRVGAVIFSWTATALTVTVTCTDIDGAGVSDVAASNYTGTAAPGTSVAITNDPIDVLVTFGDATGERTAYLQGVTKTVTQNFGSVALGTNESFDISSVTILGAADVTGPTVKPTFPLKPNAQNKIDITGTATDLTGVSLDSVTVNGVATTASKVSIADPKSTGVWTWSVTGLPLKKGVNNVALTFSDDDNNPTTVTKSYTLK